MNICSIDPGSKNFAICIENVSYEKLKLLNCPKKTERYISDGIRQDTKNKKDILIPSLKYKEFLNEVILCSKTVLCENIDITMGEKMKNSKNLTDKMLLNINTYLQENKNILDKCDVILIEKQMSFKGKNNPMAIKIAHFCYSWFLINYGESKKIIDFMAYNKTQVMGAQNNMNKAMRKKWSSKQCVDIWNARKDDIMIKKLEKIKKKDDIGDTLLMCLSYIIMDYY